MENNNEKIFYQRLDFYWQAIVIYLIVLVTFSVLSGTISSHSLNFSIQDPMVMLFAIFIGVSGVSYLFSIVRNKQLIVGEDYFKIKTRFAEKTYPLGDIKKIFVGREGKLQSRENKNLFLVKLKTRRRGLRIRPSSYWDDKELFDALSELRSKLNQLGN